MIGGRFVCLCVVVLAGAGMASADDDFALRFADASLRTSREGVSHWQIVLRTSANLGKSDRTAARASARFEILDLDAGQLVANMTFRNPGAGSEVVIENAISRYLILRLPQASLNAAGHYLMVVAGLTYEGKPVQALSVPLVFVPAAGTPAAVTPGGPSAKEPPLTFSKALKRDDADFYISGELDTVSRVASPDDHKVDGIADVELGYKFQKTLWGHVQTFKPDFTLKASSEKGHDPNSMSFGVRWDSPLHWFWLRWRKEPKIESNKNFSESDAIVATSLRFLPRDWHGIYLTPFVGGEFGGTFRSPLPEARGTAVVRGLIGTELDYNYNLKLPGLNRVGFSAAYTRRLLARPEVAVDDSDLSALTPLLFGRSPHDHVEAKFKLFFTNLFGTTIGYEYGDLPPTYSRVYNQFKIGLLYQAAVKAR